jgi:hypothetical protein
MKEVQPKGEIQPLPGYESTWFAPAQGLETLCKQNKLTKCIKRPQRLEKVPGSTTLESRF